MDFKGIFKTAIIAIIAVMVYDRFISPSLSGALSGTTADAQTAE